MLLLGNINEFARLNIQNHKFVFFLAVCGTTGQVSISSTFAV